jgi:hypothetical protein
MRGTALVCLSQSPLWGSGTKHVDTIRMNAFCLCNSLWWLVGVVLHWRAYARAAHGESRGGSTATSELAAGEEGDGYVRAALRQAFRTRRARMLAMHVVICVPMMVPGLVAA